MAVWTSLIVKDHTPQQPYREGPAPLPYPRGWCVLAPSADVRPGAVAVRRLMGEDVVVYRTASGVVRAVEPYCPHLGAHLGNSRVEQDCLVCPFHGFAFGLDGAMTRPAPGYSDLPPHRQLRVLHTQEVNGAILVWTGADPPSWHVPQLLHPKNTPPKFTTVNLFSHPQEIFENTVDTGHIPALHGFLDLEMPEPAVADGHIYHVHLRVGRRYPPFGTIRSNLDFTLYGLGVLHVVVHISEVGLTFDALLSPRPVNPWQVHLAVATSVSYVPNKGIARRLPTNLKHTFTRIASLLNHHMLLTDLMRDFTTWQSKRYIVPPSLAKGDGPIGPFRKWAQQFYPPVPTSSSTTD